MKKSENEQDRMLVSCSHPATISFPFVLTGKRLGRTRYPKRLRKILIYLPDHSACFRGNTERIARELSITLIEELTHAFYEGRTPNHHDWDSFLSAL